MRSRSARNTPKLYHHAIKADLMDSSSISLSGTDELRTSLGLWPCAIPELIPPYKIPKEFITVEVSCYNISCTPGITGQIIPFWHATRLEVTAFQCSHLWKKCWQIVDDGHWTPTDDKWQMPAKWLFHKLCWIHHRRTWKMNLPYSAE